ncbi:hypothetical protein AB6A40_010909 [Gnathostoma spinigerum]|uniref:Uncharacterized protein n=1 Tax=Gnathostoma spinigerum TaxID=75299 RepID=A0ABD6EW86_9BILA
MSNIQSKSSITSIGSDFESIFVAVGMFLACGLAMFSCCFVITKIYVCYKSARLKAKRRERGDEEEFAFAILNSDATFDNRSI